MNELTIIAYFTEALENACEEKYVEEFCRLGMTYEEALEQQQEAIEYYENLMNPESYEEALAQYNFDMHVAMFGVPF